MFDVNVKSELTVRYNSCGTECEYAFFCVYDGENRPMNTKDLAYLKRVYADCGGLENLVEEIEQHLKQNEGSTSGPMYILHPETGGIFAELNPFPIKGNLILNYNCTDKKMLYYAEQAHLDKRDVAMLMGR